MDSLLGERTGEGSGRYSPGGPGSVLSTDLPGHSARTPR